MNDQFLQSVTIDWNKVSAGSYLQNVSAIRSLRTLSFHAPITFLVGENGTGKSTLLEALAVAYGFNPEGGTRNYSFSTYDSHSELHGAIRLSRGFHKPYWGYFLRAESFYNVASKEEEYAKDFAPSMRYHERSHGEAFLTMMQKELKADSIYFFDEPEAALSPQRQLTVLMEIYNSVREGSQFIIATHSPILLGMPDAEIFSFDGGKIHPISYEETDSYQVTEMFINNRGRLLDRLLEH